MAGVALLGHLVVVPGAAALAVPSPPQPPLAILLIGVATFALAEMIVLHIRSGTDAETFSISEVPLVFGLFFATPAQLVTARLLGSTIALWGVRRQPLRKLAFNLAVMWLETVVALLLLRALVAPGAAASATTGFAVVLTVAVADAVTGLAVVCVLALVRRRLERGDILPALTSGMLPALTGAVLAFVVAALIQQDVAFVWTFGALAALLGFAYRAHTTLRRRHDRLAQIATFTRAPAGETDTAAAAAAFIARARELLGGGGAEFVAALHSGERLRLVDGWLPEAPPGRCLSELLARGSQPGIVRATAAAAAGVDGLLDAVLAPIRGDHGMSGWLLVGNPDARTGRFDRDDLHVLETIANHAAALLRSAELTDALRGQVVAAQHQARHDSLTGLPNRTELTTRLHLLLAAGRSAAVAILDLDRFKEVNDALGHHVGDQLLIEVALRLKAAVGDEAEVARLGGDEFALLLADGDRAAACRLADRVRIALMRPVPLQEGSIEVAVSIGMALAPTHGNDPFQLLQRADIAMYHAKKNRLGLTVFTGGADRDAHRHLLISKDLRDAIAQGAVTAVYQPVLDLRHDTVSGVEVLARWHHPVLGHVPPEEFVRIAEHTGMIRELTFAMLRQAIERRAAWGRDGAELGVAVNLSPRTLLDASFSDELAGMLAGAAVPPGVLTLELTEGSLLADPVRAVEALHRLHAVGVRIAIDDFGTGYSSLSYLRRLPLDAIKIDRSFLIQGGDGGGSQPIIRAIIDLGHHLGMEIVAEGVEDGQAIQLLRALGCDHAQGYHISRPLPADALAAWLGTYRRARRVPRNGAAAARSGAGVPTDQ